MSGDAPLDAQGPARSAETPPREGRSLRSRLVAAAALAAIGVAGVVSYRSVRDELEALFAAWRSARAPAAGNPDQGASPSTSPELADWILRDRLVVVRGAKESGDRAVVVMGIPTGGGAGQAPNEQSNQGLLAREIIRQAVLIAARDELGLATRDELLDDAPPVGAGSASAEVSWLIPTDARGWIEINGGNRPPATLLAKHVLAVERPHYELDKLVAVAEALSRSEIPRALKALGLAGAPNPVRAAAELPALVEERLANLGFADPFAAVRDLHAAIRADGESPARLGALVRGYALLGALTDFHWSPAHKAFKARALLYAQRLVARDPKSPAALRHRAFAESLAGLHRFALADLAEAKTQAGAKADQIPPWVDVIDACCCYDLDRLKVTEGPQAKLAALLRMGAVEYPAHYSVARRAARDVLALDPACFRAHDVLCEAGGVSNLHVATTIAPQVLEQLVPRRLATLVTLPASVRERLDRQAGEIALVEALQRAGEPGLDQGEPAWGVLAHVIRETRFVQVWRRLDFMRRVWSVPVDEFWADQRPHVLHHRYRPYLDVIALPAPDAVRALGELIETLDVTALEHTESPMLRTLNDRSSEPKARDAFVFGSLHVDFVARDLTRLMENTAESTQAQLGMKLLWTSPNNPYAMAKLVEHDWKYAKERFAVWEKEAGQTPVMLAALSKRYTALGEIDKAQDSLTRYIRQSPDHWAYAALAKTYKDRGDTEHWLQTLERYLDQGTDPGLNDARVRVEIADYYMGLGRWQQAQPYAEAAAATWAEWAMRCAVNCYEGMQDWPRAELWVSRLAERYSNTSLYDWILFCKRTGHGDAEAARDQVERYFAAVGDRPDLVDPERAGYFYWLTGDPKKALVLFAKAYEAKASVSAGTALVLMADDLGDLARRDAVLEELCTRHAAKAPLSTKVLALLRESLSHGESAAIDLKAVDQVIASIPPEHRGLIEFFVSWFLRKHGRPEDAQAYLRRSIESPNTFIWALVIAIDTLRKGGPGDNTEPARIDPRKPI
jgi:tetratricopeptide (TPR) repeat protein